MSEVQIKIMAPHQHVLRIRGLEDRDAAGLQNTNCLVENSRQNIEWEVFNDMDARY